MFDFFRECCQKIILLSGDGGEVLRSKCSNLFLLFAFLGGSAPFLPLPLVVGYFQAFCQQKQKVYQVSARTVTEMELL